VIVGSKLWEREEARLINRHFIITILGIKRQSDFNSTLLCLHASNIWFPRLSKTTPKTFMLVNLPCTSLIFLKHLPNSRNFNPFYRHCFLSSSPQLQWPPNWNCLRPHHSFKLCKIYRCSIFPQLLRLFGSQEDRIRLDNSTSCLHHDFRTLSKFELIRHRLKPSSPFKSNFSLGTDLPSAKLFYSQMLSDCLKTIQVKDKGN